MRGRAGQPAAAGRQGPAARDPPQPGDQRRLGRGRQEIVHKHYVNLGIAAATPRGLIVPNIKDAQAKTLPELAAALGELVATAREGKTSPAAMQGGTVTITNVGVFGVDTGTPILNPGESAILAFGAVKRPAVGHKGKVKPARSPRSRCPSTTAWSTASSAPRCWPTSRPSWSTPSG